MRLEAVRDAGMELWEMTNAALDWYLRHASNAVEGQYGIYLEARGLMSMRRTQIKRRKDDSVSVIAKPEPDADVR